VIDEITIFAHNQGRDSFVAVLPLKMKILSLIFLAAVASAFNDHQRRFTPSTEPRRYFGHHIGPLHIYDSRSGPGDDLRSNKHRIAVLIDGDNAESSLIAEYISEAGRLVHAEDIKIIYGAQRRKQSRLNFPLFRNIKCFRFGKVTVKRIYADWTTSHMKGWKEQLNSYAVRPIQKFAYTKAKSSTDTALIIDAMDLLHSKLVDGFCIVSSDSDYTGLAHRIREEGLFIMGIGRAHTPEAFVKSCESFTFAEILLSTITPSGTQQEASKVNKKGKYSSKKTKAGTAAAVTASVVMEAEKPQSLPTGQPIDLDKVRRAFSIAVNIDNGQAMLSRVSETLRTQDPTFDPRNFGFSSFRKFCDALYPYFEVVVDTDNTTMFLRERQDAPAAVLFAPVVSHKETVLARPELSKTTEKKSSSRSSKRRGSPVRRKKQDSNKAESAELIAT
jgi:uncharacterized LabA/DUF88 family protein